MTTLQPKPENKNRALLMGAFSTVGDIEVLQQVEQRLRQIGLAFDVSPFSKDRRHMERGWVHATEVSPEEYSHVVFVCGPFTRHMMEKRWRYLHQFRHCSFVGVNLTLVDDPLTFNPFEMLIERDSTRIVRPDMSFLQDVPKVPVVGVCLVDRQNEYGARQRHDAAKAQIERLVERSGVAAVDVDTRLHKRDGHVLPNGFRNPGQFESVISKFDAVVTNRLHGMVLSLKNGVPVLAIDSVAGGDKVTRQARLLGWPEVFDASVVTDAQLDDALKRSLDPLSREKATEAAAKARKVWEESGDLEAFSEMIDLIAAPERRAMLRVRSGFIAKLRQLFIGRCETGS